MARSKQSRGSLTANGKNRHKQSVDDRFIQKLLRTENGKKAKNLAAEQAALEFDAAHPEFEELYCEVVELDKQYKESCKEDARLQGALSKTPENILCSDDGEGGSRRGFLKWSVSHQSTIVICLTAVVTLLYASFSTVFANLMATGEPVFLANKELAGFIAAMPVCGAILIKLGSNFFQLYENKKRYTLSIFGLSVVALLSWISLFALNFTGLSGGPVDLGDFGPSDPKGPLLTGVQILAEILIGAALALHAGDIALRYSPDMYQENLAYKNASKSRKRHGKAHKSLCKKHKKKRGRFVQLKADRDAFINNQRTTYMALRAQFDAFNAV